MLKAGHLNAVRFLVHEELRARRWSHVQLATAMQMHGRFDVVYSFLDGNYELNEEIANGLAKAFDVRADWWIALNDLIASANVEAEASVTC